VIRSLGGPWVFPFLLALIVIAPVAVAGCASLGQTSSPQITVGQLEGDPAAFDGQLVTVTGQVSNLRLWPGFRSRPKHKFELVEGSQAVSVLWGGWPVCPSGSSATVDGRYRQRDGIITASWVSCS
jgi:hypothetical protein